MQWEMVLGLEVHTQLATKSKLFSAAATEYGAKPNLVQFYKKLDPTNSFNPGIGKTSKNKDWR